MRDRHLIGVWALTALVTLALGFAQAMVVAAERDVLLADAAQAGDIVTVEALLQAGGDVDVPNSHGTTALHWASYRDDVAMVARLIAAGADVNRANRYGATPLSLACVAANPAIVKPLLDVGALPNLRAAGEPPLLTCARTGRVETVELLLAHGANPNVTDDWKGQTALMWAVAEDHVAIIDTLVAHGADVNVTATGLTPLLLAVQLGQEASMHTLLAAGADVTVTSPAKQPLTHVAAATDHHQLGPTLLEHGVDSNARNARGQTTLHAVLEARRLKHQSRRTTPSPESFVFMEQLIAHGAEIDARVVTPPKPETVKPEAADEGDSDTNEEANADDETDPDPDPDDKPDPADNYSRIDSQTDLTEATPLLYAARSGDVDALRLLLEDGADPLAVTKGGNTALTLAAGVVFHEGGQGQGEGPPKADALEAVQLLLALGCDVNARNERGQTALHGAVYRAANDLIRFLVANGAKMDAEDERGRTPLELAEIGPNQGASRIRRDAAAALLRELEEQAQARLQATR